jgi:hypothetical protein
MLQEEFKPAAWKRAKPLPSSIIFNSIPIQTYQRLAFVYSDLSHRVHECIKCWPRVREHHCHKWSRSPTNTNAIYTHCLFPQQVLLIGRLVGYWPCYCLSYKVNKQRWATSLGTAMISGNIVDVRYNIGKRFPLLTLVAVWPKHAAYTLKGVVNAQVRTHTCIRFYTCNCRYNAL